MINKLKRRFTVLATVSMVVLMTVLVLIMNIVNYTSVVNDSDTVIDVLAQPNAPFADFFTRPDKQPAEIVDAFIPRGMSPEVPYESRYFTVTVDADGTVQESDLSRIISVDSDSMNAYIQTALANDNERGFVGQFRYLKQTSDFGTRVTFLDCGRKFDSFKTFFWTSVCVGLFGCIVVFIAFLLVSGKIVKPIAESYEKQKRFISDAGHEIKTPLTVINANVDLLECDGEKEELTEIRNQAKRLTVLTNNLVSLSKMEEAEHNVQKIALPLSDIVAETANTFCALTNVNGITYTREIVPDVSITASPDMIRQLVSILLENAVKYTSAGGSVSVTLQKAKKSASLCVSNTTRDTVNPADLPRVFDRFYRTDVSRNSATGGHGIGLSIAKAIVDAHNGTITATTKTGSDFCVTAELPL